ncbi:unnamed protein product [Cylindrotheca closterium]|uniref:Uncharacterized protein n=1 Tax=Cylindrotheca closterium TaxID=2856 RepID=A0AAD2FYG0_9STRA|nr:unnamed protein product [Cylindrotheca closterium]
MYRRRALLIIVLQSLTQSNVGASKLSVPLQTHSIRVSIKHPIWFRGGALSASASASSSKKKKKKKSKKAAGQDSKPAKNAIANAMEKDSTEALGDAIRERADILRDDDPLLKSIEWSIASVGYAMGASDQRMSEGGGVEAATTSVIANYFLKSHGGVHGLQFACSFLASISGLCVLLFQNSSQALVMLQRTMIFAMIKHVSGIFAAASIAAKAIPKIGFSNARQWMEKLVLDPVSQYVFFTALVLVWLPSMVNLDSCWWWGKTPLMFVLVGPILSREIISSALVVADVLVLLSISTDSKLVDSVLKVANSTVNAIMSLLGSAKSWRTADPSKRQAILANLVSDTSLGMEVGVGLLMLADTVYSLSKFAFASGQIRPPFQEMLSKLLCIRLYIHFLWIRRKKITKVSMSVRGGALKFPFWFLDICDHPLSAMGIADDGIGNGVESQLQSWKDYARTALAF